MLKCWKSAPRTLTALMLACVMATGCTVTADERVGEAQGYGGTLRVAVTLSDGKIESVQVTDHSETQGIGTRAVEALPDAIVKANSPEVEVVSGATVTSKAIMAAVRDALGTEGDASPDANASPNANTSPNASVSPMDGLEALTTDPPASPQPERTGVGMSAMGRIGPGEDDAGVPVYSFNVVFACASFDGAGRITTLNIDQLEVATPNYDGEDMPEFSGFPGQGGYAKWDDAAGKTSGKTEDTDEAYLDEISAWTTKRMRGDSYRLASGTWAEQMDRYERLFTGMTVEEIEAWVGRYCSDVNGRPLSEKSSMEGDGEKYAALSDEEKAMLADVTASATISLNDAHGNVIEAIRRAWEDAQ